MHSLSPLPFVHDTGRGCMCRILTLWALRVDCARNGYFILTGKGLLLLIPLDHAETMTYPLHPKILLMSQCYYFIFRRSNTLLSGSALSWNCGHCSVEHPCGKKTLLTKCPAFCPRVARSVELPKPRCLSLNSITEKAIGRGGQGESVSHSKGRQAGRQPGGT